MADSSKVADAYVEVRADTSKVPKDLNKVPDIVKRMVSAGGLKQLTSAIGGNAMVSQIGNIAGLGGRAIAAVGAAGAAAAVAVIAVGAVAVASIAAMIKAAHKASEDLKTASLIKATGEAAGWTAEQLEHMNKKLREGSGFSGKDISGAQQQLLLHPNVGGKQFKDALQVSADVAAATGQDLKGVASSLGSVLADPLSAADGALEKFGILLKPVEQGQIRNAMAARDWAKAQDLILSKFNGYGGAAKKAGETGSGGFEKLQNAVEAAVESLGALLPDIGLMASKTADAIDAFMKLTIVKDAIDLILWPFREAGKVAEEFFANNTKDFVEWGDLISETYHNIRDQVLQVWEVVSMATKTAWEYMMRIIGPVWSWIKDRTRETLDAMSLLTADFGLTAEFVWAGIKYGAQVTWDAIKNGLTYLRITFVATWESFAAAASESWNQVKRLFKGEMPDISAIAVQSGIAFGKSFSEGVKEAGITESDAAKQLRNEFNASFEAMKKKRDELRAKRKAETAAEEAKIAKLEMPGEDKKVNTKRYEFAFTGFEELAKKIQTSIYPTEAIQLQKAGVKAAERAADNGGKIAEKIDKLNDTIKGGFGFK